MWNYSEDDGAPANNQNGLLPINLLRVRAKVCTVEASRSGLPVRVWSVIFSPNLLVFIFQY